MWCEDLLNYLIMLNSGGGGGEYWTHGSLALKLIFFAIALAPNICIVICLLKV